MQYPRVNRAFMITSIIGLAITLLLLYLVLRDMVYFGGAPQEVTDVAMDQLVEVCIKKYGDRCNDFRIIRAQEKNRTDARQVNSAEAAWCAELQMKTFGYSSLFGQDTQHLFIEVAHSNDTLTVLDTTVLTEPRLSEPSWKTKRDALWNNCLTQ